MPLKLVRELVELTEKKKKIENLVILGVFDTDTYRQHKEEVIQEILIKKIELSEIKIDRNEVERCINFFEYFVRNLAGLWKTADLGLKQRIQSLISPLGVSCRNNTF